MWDDLSILSCSLLPYFYLPSFLLFYTLRRFHVLGKDIIKIYEYLFSNQCFFFFSILQSLTQSFTHQCFVRFARRLNRLAYSHFTHSLLIIAWLTHFTHSLLIIALAYSFHSLTPRFARRIALLPPLVRLLIHSFILLIHSFILLIHSLILLTHSLLRSSFRSFASLI